MRGAAGDLSVGGELVATAEVLVDLVHGAPLDAFVGVDPVDESFVHGQHLWSTRHVGMHRDLWAK